MEKQNILKDPSIDGVKVKLALYSQSYDILLLNSGTAGHLFIRKLSKLLSLCAAGVMKVKNAEFLFVQDINHIVYMLMFWFGFSTNMPQVMLLTQTGTVSFIEIFRCGAFL